MKAKAKFRKIASSIHGRRATYPVDGVRRSTPIFMRYIDADKNGVAVVAYAYVCILPTRF